MRARGAQGADIVILVVAVDDGVQPQTREAIDHARAARVPIVVALNKVDKADANLDKTKKDLAALGLVPDEWEGNTIMVPVSAKQKTGLDDLLEAILLVADSSDIRANPSGKVIGTVIESQMDKSRGVTATLLVQNGTLQAGEVIVAGNSYGRIKAMEDFRGKSIRKAEPSTPVLVLGLNDVPVAGDNFEVVDSEKEARAIVAERIDDGKSKKGPGTKTTLEDVFDKIKKGEMKELRLIVKADAQGSLQPIESSLRDLNEGDIKVNILHKGTGNVNESDIMMASADGAVIVGFNVQVDADTKRLADGEGVSIRLYDIIYRLIEDVEKALKGMLEPEYKEVVLGMAVVQAVFKASKMGAVAGCKVVKGEIHRNARVHIIRNNEQVFDGEIASLRHEKEDEKRSGRALNVALA